MSYIALAGIIGAGKTYISDRLAKILNVEVIHEPQLNPEKWADGILGDFYDDMKRYGFMFQIYLAYARCNALKKTTPMVDANNTSDITNGTSEVGKTAKLVAISDRSVYEDLIFSRMLCDSGMMEEREHELHRHVLMDLMNNCGKPRVIIRIDTNPDRAYKNLVLRKREEEMSIGKDYIISLNEYYNSHFKKFCPIETIAIENNTIFETEEKNNEFMGMILRKLLPYLSPDELTDEAKALISI